MRGIPPRDPATPGTGGSPLGPASPQDSFRSHWIPRTPAGLGSVVAFLILFALTQPPVVHTIANRITPWIAGMPFLYAWLLGIYLLLIGVLLFAQRWDV
jgi:hypothetical protein